MQQVQPSPVQSAGSEPASQVPSDWHVPPAWLHSLVISQTIGVGLVIAVPVGPPENTNHPCYQWDELQASIEFFESFIYFRSTFIRH